MGMELRWNKGVLQFGFTNDWGQITESDWKDVPIVGESLSNFVGDPNPKPVQIKAEEGVALFLPWVSVKDKLPENPREYVLACGPTGYSPPDDVFLIRATYNPGFENPKTRWRDPNGTSLEARDWRPQFWTRTKLKLPKFEAEDLT